MNAIESLIREIEHSKTAVEAVNRWLFCYGGQSVYLPKLYREARNQEIINEYQANNLSIAQLSAKYQLSEKQLLRILHKTI